MSSNKVPVAGQLGTTSPTDTYPVFEDTDGLGGFRVVADENAMNAIPAERRKEGMEVKRLDDGNTYELKNGVFVVKTSAGDVQALLDLKEDKANKGQPNGYAGLDENSKISATNLPTHVSSVNTRSGDVTLSKSDVGLSNVDNTADASKEVLSATKLKTPRTINGVPFDGTQNISIPSAAAPSINALDVEYNNITYPTVAAALDKLLYVPVTVSLSGGSLNEIGTTINSVVLNWTTNKDVVSQSINNSIGSIASNLRTYTHSGQTITTNRTYTITVNDGTQDAVSSTSVNFLYKRYWGVTSAATITDANIFSLNKELSGTRTQARTFDCSGGRYFWVIYPQSYGTANFKVGGLSFSDMNLEVRTITNESGASVTLNIYRVNGIQTGSAINVEVL